MSIPKPDDITPVVAFERDVRRLNKPPYRHTATHTQDVVLGGDPAAIELDLALAAIELVEELATVRDLLCRSLMFSRHLSERIDTLSAENAAIRGENRELRRRRGEAA